MFNSKVACDSEDDKNMPEPSSYTSLYGCGSFQDRSLQTFEKVLNINFHEQIIYNIPRSVSYQFVNSPLDHLLGDTSNNMPQQRKVEVMNSVLAFIEGK